MSVSVYRSIQTESIEENRIIEFKTGYQIMITTALFDLDETLLNRYA